MSISVHCIVNWKTFHITHIANISLTCRRRHKFFSWTTRRKTAWDAKVNAATVRSNCKQHDVCKSFYREIFFYLVVVCTCGYAANPTVCLRHQTVVVPYRTVSFCIIYHHFIFSHHIPSSYNILSCSVFNQHQVPTLDNKTDWHNTKHTSLGARHKWRHVNLGVHYKLFPSRNFSPVQKYPPIPHGYFVIFNVSLFRYQTTKPNHGTAWCGPLCCFFGLIWARYFATIWIL